VLQIPPEKHRDKGDLTANSTASSRGSSDGARRRTAAAAPTLVSASWWRCARGRERATRTSSSPPCGSLDGLHVGREAVTTEIERSGGRARVQRWRRSSSAARVRGRGGVVRARRRPFKGPRESPSEWARGSEVAWHGRRVGPESGSAGGARWAMTGGARPSATTAGGGARLGLAGPEARLAKKWREGKRPAEKRSRGTTGLREMGCATKQEKRQEGFSFFSFLKNQSNQ
jgi:hypothetical protein